MEALVINGNWVTVASRSMSARDKNNAAIARLFGQTLDSFLAGCQVAVHADGVEISDTILTAALGELFGRFWPRINVSGRNSAVFAQAARSAAASGGQPDPIVNDNILAANYVVSVGSPMPLGVLQGVVISANGYRVRAGAPAIGGSDRNPVGPFVAATLAAAEAFKAIFGRYATSAVIELPPELEIELDFIRNNRQPLPTGLRFDDVVVVGVGAVTHTLLWLLERWPHEVVGRLILVDHDKYDISNGQRYVGMRHGAEQFKSVEWAMRLRESHPGLMVEPSTDDMNTYFEHRSNPAVRLVVAGLDSTESRRQLALKLPRRVINMWTSGEYAGASIHATGGTGACLFDAYPEERGQVDEVHSIAQQTGLGAPRIRELLDSAAPLTDIDSTRILQRFPSLGVLSGKPLRSVLPAFCAVVPLQTGAANEQADVPFAPVSAFAGAFGFISLLLALADPDRATASWQSRLFANPTSHSWRLTSSRPDCYVCTDPIVRDLLTERFR